MNSLRQVLEFTGLIPNLWGRLPNGDGEAQPTMRTIGTFISMTESRKKSLREMIPFLEALPQEMGLTMSGVHTNGPPPFYPIVQIGGANSIVISTIPTIYKDNVLYLIGNDVGVRDRDVSLGPLENGRYKFNVQRVGITGSGVKYASLEVPVVVGTEPTPQPQPQPQPRPNPTLYLTIEMNPHSPHVSDKTIKVTGIGFMGNETVTVTIKYRPNRNEEDVNFYDHRTVQAVNGIFYLEYNVSCGEDVNRTPEWRFSGKGNTSGRASNEAVAGCR